MISTKGNNVYVQEEESSTPMQSVGQSSSGGSSVELETVVLNSSNIHVVTGVGINDLEITQVQSSQAGGDNIVTFIVNNEKEYNIAIKNGRNGDSGKNGLSFILETPVVYIKVDSNGKPKSNKSAEIRVAAYSGGAPTNILKKIEINSSGCSPSPFTADGIAPDPVSSIAGSVMFRASYINSISDDANISLKISYLDGTVLKNVTMNCPIIAVKDGSDYVISSADYDAIAAIVAEKLKDAQSN